MVSSMSPFIMIEICSPIPIHRPLAFFLLFIRKTQIDNLELRRYRFSIDSMAVLNPGHSQERP